MNRKYKKILNCYRLFIAQARRLRQQEKGNVKKNRKPNDSDTKHMKTHTLIVILFLIFSCKQKENQKVKIAEQNQTIELNQQKEIFDQNLINSLYGELKSKFEIDFSRKHLTSLLNGISVTELKNGKEFEKEMLFEVFKCECYDKIKISYSQSESRFILFVYEEFYEEELDWCPESSYSYSFGIKNLKIVDLKLDFMAG